MLYYIWMTEKCQERKLIKSDFFRGDDCKAERTVIFRVSCVYYDNSPFFQGKPGFIQKTLHRNSFIQK